MAAAVIVAVTLAVGLTPGAITVGLTTTVGDGVTVTVGVGVAVVSGAGVSVGVGVNGATVAVGDDTGVGVGVNGTTVAVGDDTGVGVGVGVSCNTGVNVAGNVGIGVGSGCGAGVGVADGFCATVGVGRTGRVTGEAVGSLPRPPPCTFTLPGCVGTLFIVGVGDGRQFCKTVVVGVIVTVVITIPVEGVAPTVSIEVMPD